MEAALETLEEQRNAAWLENAANLLEYLREIGEVLGVTESRVSQLHTKAVLALRSGFATRSDEI